MTTVKKNVSRETVYKEMLTLIEQIRTINCGTINCKNCPFETASKYAIDDCFAIIAGMTRGALQGSKWKGEE